MSKNTKILTIDYYLYYKKNEIIANFAFELITQAQFYTEKQPHCSVNNRTTDILYNYYINNLNYLQSCKNLQSLLCHS